MHYRSLFVIALAVSAAQFTCRSQEVLDGIAAVVNDDVITFSQVRELIGPTEMAARKELKGEELVQRVKEIRLRAINDLIERQLIIQELNKDKFHEQRREEFAMDDQIKLRMIAIGKRGGDNGADKGHDMISKIRRKILGGTEFADMARLYSEEEHQDDGGDWGWINRKRLNESLTKTAFTLKPGVVSPIVELGNRYYLLLVEAKKNSTVKPMTEPRKGPGARRLPRR